MTHFYCRDFRPRRRTSEHYAFATAQSHGLDLFAYDEDTNFRYANVRESLV